MRRAKILGCLIVLAALPAYAGSPSPQEAAVQEIRQVMAKQVEAWNRGDVTAFMQGYKDDSGTIFIGKSVTRGYSTVLDHYKQAYASRDAMGVLEFTDLEVRCLDPGYAIATGRFHLKRTAAGGGDAGGLFSLVWEHTSVGWKIILDHTSSTP